jgi:hypothetical protein
MRTIDETYCGLRYGAGFRWRFGDGFPTCLVCQRAMPPQNDSLIEVALAAKSLCRELNQWCNKDYLPTEVIHAQAVLEELLEQYARYGLTLVARDAGKSGPRA